MPTDPALVVHPLGGRKGGAERILFIRSDRMGDVLMNLPAVRCLRQNYPKAWLTWMVDRSVAPLLRDHPDVDEIFEIDNVKLREDAAYRRELLQRVRKIKFDLGIASNAEKFFHWMLFRAGIPVRAGWARKWGFLLNRRLGDDKASVGRHEIDSNLKLVGLVGNRAWDGSWRLPVDSAAVSAIEKRLTKEFPELEIPVVVVHAGTSDPDKRWPAVKFAAACSRLLEQKRARVLLVGGSEEEAQSRELFSCLPEGAADWTGALNLKELSALLHAPRLNTVLSVDSGPVHIAWLHGKPVVALYAKNTQGSNPTRWGPKSAGSVVIYKNIPDISSEEVASALDAVLAR